jgi:hypothetical protein
MPVLTRYDILLGSLAILFSLALFVAHTGKKRLPYPPGPKRLPIVGNLFNMPSRDAWVTYRKWSQEFGRTRNVIVLRPPSTEVRHHSDWVFVRFRRHPCRCDGLTYCYSQLDQSRPRPTGEAFLNLFRQV